MSEYLVLLIPVGASGVKPLSLSEASPWSITLSLGSAGALALTGVEAPFRLTVNPLLPAPAPAPVDGAGGACIPAAFCPACICALLN